MEHTEVMEPALKAKNSIEQDNLTDKQKLALSLISKMERKIDILFKVIAKDNVSKEQ